MTATKQPLSNELSTFLDRLKADGCIDQIYPSSEPACEKQLGFQVSRPKVDEVRVALYEGGTQFIVWLDVAKQVVMYVIRVIREWCEAKGLGQLDEVPV